MALFTRMVLIPEEQYLNFKEAAERISDGSRGGDSSLDDRLNSIYRTRNDQQVSKNPNKGPAGDATMNSSESESNLNTTKSESNLNTTAFNPEMTLDDGDLNLDNAEMTLDESSIQKLDESTDQPTSVNSGEVSSIKSPKIGMSQTPSKKLSASISIFVGFFPMA